ncbi:hypothetical protein DFQ26_005804 [Actinomortierella ambigua]|nr:hypothetical protein DFQ26_005804 [Actinomortierella ambigua]
MSSTVGTNGLTARASEPSSESLQSSTLTAANTTTTTNPNTTTWSSSTSTTAAIEPTEVTAAPPAPVVMHPAIIVTSREEQSAKLLIPAPAGSNTALSPRSPLSSATSSVLAQALAPTTLGSAFKNAVGGSPASVSNISPSLDSKENGAVAPSPISNQQQQQQQQQQQHGPLVDQKHANEFIAHQVLERSKILKASRRVRTRLQYAILKIRRGWSKYTLQEVESLLQPGRSPRISARSPLKRDRDIVESSPRHGGRRKLKTSYAYYDQPTTTTYHHVYQGQGQDQEQDQDQDQDQDQNQDQDDNVDGEEDEAPIRPPMRHSRTRMSLSQFTDSELYLPAKSLLSIATSRPSPGYASPYMQAHGSPFYSRQTIQHSGSPSLYHDAPLPAAEIRSHSANTPWSDYTMSATTPQTTSSGSFMDIDDVDDQGTPSEAQVAHTILMLSSPTRPPSRIANQQYIVEMHSGSPTPAPISEWSGSYAPNMSSSSYAPYQSSTASTTPVQSPLLSSQLPYGQLGDNVKMEQQQDQLRPLTAAAAAAAAVTTTAPVAATTASKPPRLPYIANMYGMSHGPSSPSPLSISTLAPSPSANKGDESSMSRNASPTLKRAVKFAAEHMESGDVQHTSFSDSPPPDHQHHHPYSTSSSPFPTTGEPSMEGGDGGYHRTVTPPPRSGGHYSSTSSSSSSSSGAHHHHGMRTPPPSAENEIGMEGYPHQHLPPIRHFSKGPTTPDAMIQAERIRVKRRNSGLAGGSDVDLRTLYPTSGAAQRSPHSSQPHSPAVHQ